jgi:hypothetical protein
VPGTMTRGFRIPAVTLRPPPSAARSKTVVESDIVTEAGSPEISTTQPFLPPWSAEELLRPALLPQSDQGGLVKFSQRGGLGRNF